MTIVHVVAYVIGYSVMVVAGLAALGYLCIQLIDRAAEFFGFKRTLIAACWLVIRDPERVAAQRKKIWDD